MSDARGTALVSLALFVALLATFGAAMQRGPAHDASSSDHVRAVDEALGRGE